MLEYKALLISIGMATKHFGPETLRHFGIDQMGPKCPDSSAPALKCSKDPSDLSTELSSPMVRTVLPYGPKYRITPYGPKCICSM